MHVLVILSNANQTLGAWGINPLTNEGHNALIAKVLEIFPNFHTFGYIESNNTLEIVDTYLPPARAIELGEVASIDYSIGG